ncbi:MAG: hypothetical protein PHE27_08305 [Alphaproteobacteria bacterium]|nr:hypothetical protein [Alphaproteobacteria bacterium]
MNIETGRPEYYEGLKVFQQYTDQQERIRDLLVRFLCRFAQRAEEAGEASLAKGPCVWRDIGSGDGSFTSKVLDALADNGFAPPVYEGVELDDCFIAASKELLKAYPGVSIVKGSGLDGNMHERGEADVISGFNMLYFATDLPGLKADLDKALEPGGLGLFIQNTAFTASAGEAWIGKDYADYTASVPTEVFFPKVPERAFDLVTGKAGIDDILRDSVLSDEEKAKAVVIKKIFDALAGAPTESDLGQEAARKYRDRISGDDYGGKGCYVTDNVLLVYMRPDAPEKLKALAKAALGDVRREMAQPKPRASAYTL